MVPEPGLLVVDVLVFRAGGQDGAPTHVESRSGPSIGLTPAQSRVLDALCRPLIDGSRNDPPATNDEIAAGLHLSVDAVKGHLRMLFQAFGIDDLPPSHKRLRLAHHAIEAGLIGSAPRVR